MVSNEIEVLGSTATVEKLKKSLSGRALNRRRFMTALGVTGAASGAALVASRGTARPSVVQASGPTQQDVLNFALNLEYLEATFYSFVTQGVDLPANLTLGSGAITNPPAKITFTGTSGAQINDLLAEIFYDELNHVTNLRAVLGGVAINRPALNLGAYELVTATNTLSLSRLFEDVGVTAYAGAAALLSGTNLTYAAQILAVEGFHSGALRLLAIQNPTLAPFYGTTNATNVQGSTTASVNYTGTTTVGSPTITGVFFASVPPLVGGVAAGQGTAPNAVITAITGGLPISGATSVGSALITGLANTTGLAVGQTVTGAGIPNGTTITAISAAPAPYTLTLSTPVVTSTATTPLSALVNFSFTGTTAKTAAITLASSVVGLAAGQLVTGAGIPAGTTITSISGTTVNLSAITTAAASAVSFTAGTGIITMSQNAIATVANGLFLEPNDASDVITGDPGTAAKSAAGPNLAAAPEYYGFFNTSGTATASGINPTGVAFARTTSQVLAIVYGALGFPAVAGVAKGGFYPSGFNGNITTI